MERNSSLDASAFWQHNHSTVSGVSAFSSSSSLMQHHVLSLNINLSPQPKFWDFACVQKKEKKKEYPFRLSARFCKISQQTEGLLAKRELAQSLSLLRAPDSTNQTPMKYAYSSSSEGGTDETRRAESGRARVGGKCLGKPLGATVVLLWGDGATQCKTKSQACLIYKSPLLS